MAERLDDNSGRVSERARAHEREFPTLGDANK